MKFKDSKFEQWKIELIGSIVLIAVGSLFFFKFLYDYATTSLWNDEIYTILFFSSKGFIASTTDYHAPNNHILFNALNSLLPQGDPFNPLRARIVSIIAVVLSISVGVGFFFKRRRFLEGALLAVFIMLNEPLLDLTLQARGYGLLLLFTILIIVIILTPTKTRYHWYVLALSGALGTWTIPSFAFFIGAIYGVLFFIEQKKMPVVTSAGIYLLLALIVHIPVFGQVLTIMKTYAADWGKQFEFGQAVFKVFNIYAFLNSDWSVLMAIGFLVLISHLTRLRQLQEVQSGFLVLFYPVILTLIVYLYLQTPVIRTTFFVVIPFVFIPLVALRPLLRSVTYAMAITPILAIIGILMATKAKLDSYRFIPIENWKAVADTIQNNFDTTQTIFAPFRNQQLAVYLPKSYKITPSFNRTQFLEGKLICLDSDFRSEKRSDTLVNNPGVMVTDIPQRRGGYQRLLYFSRSASDEQRTASFTLTARCCGWEGKVFELKKNNPMNNVRFTLKTIRSGSSHFHVILRTREDSKFLFAGIKPPRETKTENFFLSVNDFKNVGNVPIDSVVSIELRTKSTEGITEIEISNLRWE